MIKIINTIKTALFCGYAYWKNPECYTNQGFMFLGEIMKQINSTAAEKQNFISEVATIHKDTGNEIVRISFWTGIYGSESAQSSPFERIKSFKNKRNSLIELYEKERERLIVILKPYYQKQEYAQAKEYQDRLNHINEFIAQLKILK